VLIWGDMKYLFFCASVVRSFARGVG